MRKDFVWSSGLEGIDPDLIRILGRALGFNFTFVLEPVWETYDDDGALVGGVYGSVAGGRSHIGIGHVIPDGFAYKKGLYGHFKRREFLPIAKGIMSNGKASLCETLKRKKAQFLEYDGSSLTATIELCFIAPKPRPVSPLWNLAKPYTWGAWIAILGSTLAVVFAMSALQGIAGRPNASISPVQLAGVLVNQCKHTLLLIQYLYIPYSPRQLVPAGALAATDPSSVRLMALLCFRGQRFL